MTEEEQRLEEAREHRAHWKRWGPYLSERAWGTVREDYSPDGTAWEFLPHDHARSRAYRWGEDGIAGISDRHQHICFAPAFWNGRDPILKERLFGLTGNEGNHGEDIKEYYFYLDSTPTHSYMKYLYKYPQGPFPYGEIVSENRRRGRDQSEYELIDAGLFQENRYFDIFVEYAKATLEEIAIRIEVINRGPDTAAFHLLPTLWFRNTWSWGKFGGKEDIKPRLSQGRGFPDARIIALDHPYYGQRWLACEGRPDLLFAENETNFQRLYGIPPITPYTKDAFHEYLIHGRKDAVNPDRVGTKAAAHYRFSVGPGQSVSIRLQFGPDSPPPELFGQAFEMLFEKRKGEADAFYETLAPEWASPDLRQVQRQAFAGLLWSKQFYHYVVEEWLQGDPAGPPPPPQRLKGRNQGWRHLYNADILSVPDKWEYPWYAAWDLAFHALPLALVDPDFAKEQLLLLLREWYMHPNGQLPAYEWALGDVNPPVHAWAVWEVYQMERMRRGRPDIAFLEEAFHKLLLNFTWWVNRKDADGRNVFQGGFLGLDNIGVFDRSSTLPTGGHLEQSDGTSWMGMYCLNLLTIALELSRQNPAYQGVANKFLEHFIHIAHAMHDLGGEGIELWDDHDGFFYDVLHLPDGRHMRLKVRSLVGLIPLFAAEVVEPEMIDELPAFNRRMHWFLDNCHAACEHVEVQEREDGKNRRLLSIVNQDQLRRLLAVMLDESEFLSPYGIRSLSKYHLDHPYILEMDGVQHRVGYEPAESATGLFGGNSNWRGPIWVSMNKLIIESLRKFHLFYGEMFTVECPTGSGKVMNLGEVADELCRRLIRIFLRDREGHRPVYGSTEKFHRDRYFQDLIPFYEYFHGDNGAGIGASHQTGWTALVAELIWQSSRQKQPVVRHDMQESLLKRSGG